MITSRPCRASCGGSAWRPPPSQGMTPAGPVGLRNRQVPPGPAARKVPATRRRGLADSPPSASCRTTTGGSTDVQLARAGDAAIHIGRRVPGHVRGFKGAGSAEHGHTTAGASGGSVSGHPNGQPGSTVSVTSSRVDSNTASSAGGAIGLSDLEQPELRCAGGDGTLDDRVKRRQFTWPVRMTTRSTPT